MRVLILFIAVFTVLMPVHAQAASLYGMNFLGEHIQSGDVRAIALGGSSQLLSDSLGVLQLNPAIHARLPLVTIGANMYAAYDEGRSDELTERDASFKFSQFRVAWPVARLFVLTLGYVARYDPDGSFTISNVTGSGDPYTQTFTKSGGLWAIPVSGAIKLTRFIDLGGSVNFEAGFLEERVDTRFESILFAPTFGLKKEEVTGVSWSAGLIFHPVPSFLIGAGYQSEIDYDTDVFESFTQPALDTMYTSTASVPPLISAGVTWQIGRSLLLAASATYRDYTEFHGFEFPSDRLGTEESYSGGIEFLRAIPVGQNRLPIRLGFNYQVLPYDFPQGGGSNPNAQGEIRKTLFSLGTAIRLGGGKAKVDITFQGGTIGSLNDNGLEDRVFRIYFGVVGSELWRARGRGRI